MLKAFLPRKLVQVVRTAGFSIEEAPEEDIGLK